MRLSYVVLAAATALVLTPVSTAATSDAITGIAKPKMHLSSANEDTRNDRRFLSVHKVNNGEDKEERGWSDWAAAKAILLKLALADNDGKARIISEPQFQSGSMSDTTKYKQYPRQVRACILQVAKDAKDRKTVAELHGVNERTAWGWIKAAMETGDWSG
ncbi:hypothetical protein PR001_g25374 [Phytophthora rubi]|uniref:RxLR effector protein n=2 Tax=Phytophthora rubi TaxID=129364 RepID=A0A6A3I594_9STRA|nr:hypothetical protein PR001_g25374 [Phytophthora rubi]